MKKQTYSKIIPALALLGGAYLLLSKKGTTSSTGNNNNANNQNNTGPVTPPSLPSPEFQTQLSPELQSSNNTSQVAGTEIVRGESSFKPDYNKWRGYEWYSYVEEMAKSIPKKDAIKKAFSEWNNPANKYYSMMPNEASFLLGLAMAEKMPYYNKVEFVHSGDYNHINTGYKIGATVPVNRPIRWDSQPIYDTYYGWWYDIEAWSCQDWVDWHKALEQKYNSTQRANDIWKSAWFSSQNSGANAVLENNWYYCPRDCANFVKYFASKGITDTGGGMLAPVYCDLSGIVQNIVGTIEDGTSAIANTSKVLQIALPVAVIALGYFAYKKVLPAIQKKYL